MPYIIRPINSKSLTLDTETNRMSRRCAVNQEDQCRKLLKSKALHVDCMMQSFWGFISCQLYLFNRIDSQSMEVNNEQLQ